MGSVHKLKPELIKFIIGAREKDPSLSCRGLVPLVKEEFGVRISKSSINSILKTAGKNAPVGKPSALPRGRPASAADRQAETFLDHAGVFFLKGADLKLGASFELAQAVKDSVKNISLTMLQAYNQALIYMGLFGIKDPLAINKYQGGSLWLVSELKYHRLLSSRIIRYYNLLCDKKLYYNIALRLVSLYTSRLATLNPLFAKEESVKAEFATLLFNLHKYTQKEFFPPLYQEFDFPKMQEQIYSLGGFIRRSKAGIVVRFSEYKHLDLATDIAYACRKFNDSEIKTASGQRLYLQPAV